MKFSVPKDMIFVFQKKRIDKLQRSLEAKKPDTKYDDDEAVKDKDLVKAMVSLAKHENNEEHKEKKEVWMFWSDEFALPDKIKKIKESYLDQIGS